jgi:hypothetical protein
MVYERFVVEHQKKSYTYVTYKGLACEFSRATAGHRFVRRKNEIEKLLHVPEKSINKTNN